jgi:hypothetical protein
MNRDDRNYRATSTETSSSTSPDSLLVWLPSNGSTDQSTWDWMKDHLNHYFDPIEHRPPCSLPIDDTMKKSTSPSELVPLQQYDSQYHTGSYQNGSGNSRKQDITLNMRNHSTCLWMNLVFVGSIMSVLIIISISWWSYTVILPPHEMGVRSSSSSSDNNDIVNDYNTIDKDTDIQTKQTQILNPKHHAKVPFSILDPVNDLGLYHYSRSDDSSPRSAMMLGQYSEAMKHKQDDIKDNENSNETTTMQHSVFPTNAWYQNLLMYENKTSSDQKPGLEYRAYTIPYIVDVTGPIPGLRVHANQIGASSNVIQLNIITEYGLTLGASINPIGDNNNNNDKMNNGNSSISGSDNSISQSTSEQTTTPTTTNPINTSIPNHEFQYTIHQATPLSVTLEWVSSCLQQ